MVAVFVLLQSCSPRLHTQLSWQEQPATVDEPATWLQTFVEDEKTALKYLLSNDRDNLYILIMADDEATRMRMLRGGMELVIDTMGESRDPCRILFPLKLEPGFAGGIPGRMPQGMPGGGPDGDHDRVPDSHPEGMPGRQGGRRTGGDPGPDRTAMVHHLIGLQTRAIISGFKDHPQGRLSPVTKDGIRLSVDLDTLDVVNYRAVIPLRTFYKAGITTADTVKKFGLTVKIHGVNVPSRSPGGVMVDRRMSPDRRGPYGPGGTRGMPGTADPGYGGRGVQAVAPVTSEYRELGKTLTFKTTFNLTVQQYFRSPLEISPVDKQQ